MFTPIETSLGALLLFEGSSGLLRHNGRIFGISGFLSSCMGRPSLQNMPILLGMASSIIPVYLMAPSLLPSYPSAPVGLAAALGTAATGFLVGWGTKVRRHSITADCLYESLPGKLTVIALLQNDHGCTSGHMLCGMSRLSPRSIIATGIFCLTALITANTAGAAAIPACGNKPCYTPTYPSRYEFGFISAAVVIAHIFNSIIVPRFFRRDEESATIYSYFAGLQFGLGLLITGMADPAKVLRFFSVRDLSRFDPSLGLVMLFAVVPSLLSWMKMKRTCGIEQGGQIKKPPTLTEYFQLPNKTVKDIDWRFVLGAMSFGVGWGLCGVCPGPGLLRTMLQPAWGALWLGGFWAGSSLGL